jgi:hypothetical protein
MSLLRQPIERRLSAFIGAEVTFDKLKLSLLGGSLEASGVTIAGDDAGAPLLTVRRIRAEISVARALAKQIVIKSLVIEGPVISIVLRADGSANLPQRSPADPIVQTIDPHEHEEAEKTEEDDEPSSWRMEAQRVTLVDGQIRFRDQTGGSAYFASAEQIGAEIRQVDERITVSASLENVGRRDVPVNLGPIHLTALFSDIDDLSQLGKSPVEAKLEWTGGLVADVNSQGLSGEEISVEGSGPFDLAEWVAAAPPVARLPRFLLAHGFSGRANLSLKAKYMQSTGVKVEEFILRVFDATIPL